MNLLDLVMRSPKPTPWAEGETIPWSDPGFSARMLQEHLSQVHDEGSRRFEIIDRQVAWVHEQVLGGRPARVLDLACGPGLYTSRLAKLGHTCVGIDFAPASIGYAAERAELEDLTCTYVLEDIRHAEYGTDYDLVMLLYGEFNVFRKEDAHLILRKAHSALKVGGHLLLEPHTFAAVYRMGHERAEWYTRASGLFSPEPHLVLTENFWEEKESAATRRYYIVTAANAEVTAYAQSFQAYAEVEYESLLDECGFDGVQFLPGIGEVDQEGEAELLAILAVRGEGEHFKGKRRSLAIEGDDLVDS
jgi:SAM-dependent methyltransferase